MSIQSPFYSLPETTPKNFMNHPDIKNVLKPDYDSYHKKILKPSILENTPWKSDKIKSPPCLVITEIDGYFMLYLLQKLGYQSLTLKKLNGEVGIIRLASAQSENIRLNSYI